jgi:hypothetical protein
LGAVSASATKIVELGRARQIQFAEAILNGISEEDRAVMERCFLRMNANIDKLVKEKSCGAKL